MNKCIMFLLLLIPFFLCCMEQSLNPFHRTTHHGKITKLITNNEKNKRFQKKTRKKYRRVRIINSNFVTITQVPKPNTHQFESDYKFSTTEDFNHEEEVFDYLLSKNLKRQKVEHDPKNNIKQKYDF